MKFSKEAISAYIKSAREKAVRTVIRILFFSPVALVLGMMIGMRMFETGNVSPFRSIKGTTVKISGVCKIDDQPRLPALAEDQVTVTSIDDETLTGVVRMTREAIVCDLSQIAIDKLPLFSDFNKTPAPPPDLTPAKVVEDKSFGLDLVNRTFKVSGACQNTATGGTEALLDTVVVFTSAKKKNAQDSGSILGVVKSEGRSKGSSIQCTLSEISYEPAILEESRPSEAPVVVQEEDLKGKYIVLTSTCFPDKRFKKAGDDNLFFPMINELIQITDYQKVNGKLEWLTGAHLSKGAMIECDAKKYPITWRMYDASTMKLNPMQKSK